jgi:RNA polymerase sigma factor (TIGR02999 family)
MSVDSAVPGDEEPLPGDSTGDLFALLYRELHGLAERQLRLQAPGQTLGTTTLLHEAYLSLQNKPHAQFPDRGRFLAYASRAMRGLVIDYVRRRSATKRGGEFHLVPLDSAHDTGPASDPAEMAELAAALDELGTVDAGLAQLVDLHFFCGLSFVEIAALRAVSERTVQRDWHKARLLLHGILEPPTGGAASDPLSGQET